MIKELDPVILTHDIKEHKLEQVEFVTGEGTTAAVLTLTGDDIRPMGKGEILHAREYTAA